MASLPNNVASFDGAPEPYKLVQDRKRDIDHRAKYPKGFIVRSEDSKPNARAKQPVKPVKLEQRIKYHGKTHPRYGVKEKGILTSGSASDDETRESPEHVAPDADIAYSYDSATGPTEGRDILGMAINKAVERFEIKETDKLIKNEYDVLADDDIEDEDDGLDYLVDGDFELL